MEGHYLQGHARCVMRIRIRIAAALTLVRALAKVFARLKQQSLNFDGCAVAVEESRATAHCTGWLTYVPRVGNDTPRREHHSWTIEFERTGGEWRILEVGAK